MNNTRKHLANLLGTDPAEHRHTTRVRFAVSAVAAFATAVQVIAWLMIGIFRSHLDGPWWLWTPASALVINAALLYVDRVRGRWSDLENTRESL